MKINQLELANFPLKGIALIEASAGTGKTYTISHLYLRYLLETEYEVQNILVVTFTNAATQELKGRIRELIHSVRAYLKGADPEDKQVALLFGIHRGQQLAIDKLHKAIINFDEASIYSIHGFCQRVLTSFPVETGSMLQQKLLPDEKELLIGSIRDYWRKAIISMEMDKLHWILQQWKQPDDLLKDILPLMPQLEDIAVLTQLDEPSQGQDIRQAWQAMQKIWQDSSTSIGDVILNNPALRKNIYKPNIIQNLLVELEQLFQQPVPYQLPIKWDLICAEKLRNSQLKNKHDERIEYPFFQHAQAFKEQHLYWLRQQRINVLIDAASEVQQSVGNLKKQSLNISFDDLITRLSDALYHGDKALADKITRDYPIAMVDEFQDTDNRQYFIFRTLYRDQADKSLVLIGDPKQAIYSFRGADVFTYQRAKQDTRDHFTLDINYRSSANYVDTINCLFTNNADAFVLDQLIRYTPVGFDKHHPRQMMLNNQEAEPLVAWIHPFAGKPVNKSKATDYFAKCCAREINQLLSGPGPLIDGKKIQASDLAVLVKTGRQASIIKQQLANMGIASALVLRDSVFDSRQAEDISRLLNVLIDPTNIPALSGLLSTDLFGWNVAQIEQLNQDNEMLVSLLEQFKLYQRHWREKGILSVFFLILQQHKTLQLNYLHMEGERRMTNWLHIMELLQQQSVGHASLAQSLHWLNQQRQDTVSNRENEEHQLLLESDRNLVRIVTIHKSKGLEYPIVFLPFMWDVKGVQNQPKTFSVHDANGKKRLQLYDEDQRERWHEENLAEEVRLFYVAMTRAQYRCYLGIGHIKGIGSSALAQCLFPELVKPGNYPRDLIVDSQETLRQPFEKLNIGKQRVKLEEPINFPVPITDGKQEVKSLTRAREFKRQVNTIWRISSYSQIISHHADTQIDRPDYDALIQPRIRLDDDSSDKSLDRFSFFKGAKAGTFLHDILENSDFMIPVEENLVSEKCREYGYSSDWVKPVQSWLQDVMDSELNGFSLSNIQNHQKITEMEFYLSSNSLDAKELNRLLIEHDYRQPGMTYSFARLNGYLKGFIDLVFEYEDRFYIADYKSNYLGRELVNYSIPQCMNAMHEHHYYLQYLIYTLALHRYLRQRLVDYDYNKHIGGVYYLFLRGMTCQDHGDEKTGIYFDRPSSDFIRQLDELF